MCVCVYVLGGGEDDAIKKKYMGVGQGDVIKIHGSFLTNTNHNVGPFFSSLKKILCGFECRK